MSKGRFGIHGGQYIPETLMNAVIELEEAYNHYKDDPEFNAELTMEDGTIITLRAAEGVLPAGVTAEATVEKINKNKKCKAKLFDLDDKEALRK